MLTVEKTNRRDEIVRVAADLFMREGYAATSVRDIAQKVGCTEAALYYHFKEGKRALFKAVIEMVLPSLLSVLDTCKDAQSLQELVVLYAQAAEKTMPAQSVRFRWIVSEFHNFADEERAYFYEKDTFIYSKLGELVGQFVPDRSTAEQMTWIMITITLGYMQVFFNLNFRFMEHARSVRLHDLLWSALGLGHENGSSV